MRPCRGFVTNIGVRVHIGPGGLSRHGGIRHRVGLDVGFIPGSALGGAALAPAHRIAAISRAADVTAGAAVGTGGNANALAGGANHCFALLPGFEGLTGLNVAVGVARLELRPAEEPMTGEHGTHGMFITTGRIRTPELP